MLIYHTSAAKIYESVAESAANLFPHWIDHKNGLGNNIRIPTVNKSLISNISEYQL